MKTLVTRAVVLVAIGSFGTGCASRVAQSSASALVAPSGGIDPRAGASPLPATVTGSAGNREARADHLLGSIAASVGVVQHFTDDAVKARDVVRVSCESDKLEQLWSIEADARARRSDVRAGALEDADDGSAYARLESLEARARALRDEAGQCVGEERELDSRVSDLKEQVFRTKARVAMLDETVLAGATTGLRGPVFAAPPVPPPSAPPPPPPASGTGTTSAGPDKEAHDPSMLIRTAEIALAVYEVDKNLDGVEKKAISLGGYLALRSDRQITVRVPRDKFDELVAQISTLGDVLHKNVAAEDVTDQYVDISMRLKNSTAVRDRLEKLLQTAQVRDAVEIHKELAKVTEEIERLEGKLKLLRDRIAYSTITVSFEKNQQQVVRSQALLPFPWMNTMGLGPLLRVPR